MIQDAIFARIGNVAGITALIGTSPVRCYPRLMPIGAAYPVLVYSKIHEERVKAMGVNPGLVISHWQFDAWSKDRTQCRDLAEQLRLGIERYRGTFLVGGVTKQWFDSFLENLHDPQPELVDAETVFRTTSEYLIHYQD